MWAPEIYLLTRAEAAPGPLKSLVDSRLEAVKTLLARPWVLPTALIATASRPEGATGPMRFIDGLGGAGLSTDRPPLSVLSLGPEGLRVGLRPTVAYENDALVSLSLRAGLPAGGRLVLSLEALREAPRDAKGGIAEITSAVNEARIAAQQIDKALEAKAELAPGVTLAVDAESRGDDLQRTLFALHAAGIEVVHLLKAASHGHTLPLMIRREVAGARTVLNAPPIVAYEQPTLAIVTETHVDVWAAQGPQGTPAAADKKRRPPEGTQLHYKGQRLVQQG